jgi:hypothetical protein
MKSNRPHGGELGEELPLAACVEYHRHASLFAMAFYSPHHTRPERVVSNAHAHAVPRHVFL